MKKNHIIGKIKMELCVWCEAKVKVTQSCLTLCDPMDYLVPWNSPGQTTAVGSHFFCRRSFQPRDQTQVSHVAGTFLTS